MGGAKRRVFPLGRRGDAALRPDIRLQAAGFQRYRSAGLAPWVVAVLLAVAGGAVLAAIHRKALADAMSVAYDLVGDQERMTAWLADQGAAAPLVFIGLQVLQVLLAPVPGEASGFIGGYLFGAGPGFIYSTIGLTVGSVVNFAVSRGLGRGLVRHWVADRHWQRFDRLMRHQGALAAFILFLIPGFPKDYLCLFLGLSRMSLRLFLPLVAIGRIPGTLMLSVQGAALAGGRYGLLAALGAGCAALVGLLWVYRETFYRWIERLDKGRV
jgi:uncharacterized membrane protein YdjX (TVP38/TMEM64 family)